MYSLLRRRTMMMKPSVVPTERLIYQLYDYTCDGTINTFIDTGIKLFGLEYESFRIEMEYDGLDITTKNLETLIECKSFSGKLLTNGLSVKVSISNQPEKTDAIVTNIYPCIADKYFKNTSSATVILTYDSKFSTCSINVNGSTETGSGIIIHTEPLTIGGRYSSHLSNPDRFVQVHISSLKIYATPSGIDTSYIYLPLTFKCLTGGDLSIKNANKSYDRNFEYSLNGGAWTAFSLPANTASKLIATLSPNDTISFRRDNDNFADAQFISDSNLTFDIYGNLLSLQYGSAFDGQIELRNTFKKAFGATFSGINVVDASKLMLTAPTLSNYCYQGLLESCTNLISAPVIFATQLGNYSLNATFKNCVNLVTAPELHATTLVEGCYNEMFDGCTSLVNAPELPATTMAKNCYHTMFKDCHSLVNAPELPATTLAQGCYQAMFQNCTSIITAPELPATTLTGSCYKEMFRGCTSLTTAPELPATTLSEQCYSLMFRDCTNLVHVPNELPATTLANQCYWEMFYSCSNLTTAPILPAKTLVKQCYIRMFNNCRKLNYIKCLATDISAEYCILYWTNSVSNTGTFVKASGVTWPSGNSGIPNGWTVIEE